MSEQVCDRQLPCPHPCSSPRLISTGHLKRDACQQLACEGATVIFHCHVTTSSIIIILILITLITSRALQRRLSTIRVDALSVIQLSDAFW